MGEIIQLTPRTAATTIVNGGIAFTRRTIPTRPDIGIPALVCARDGNSDHTGTGVLIEKSGSKPIIAGKARQLAALLPAATHDRDGCLR